MTVWIIQWPVSLLWQSHTFSIYFFIELVTHTRFLPTKFWYIPSTVHRIYSYTAVSPFKHQILVPAVPHGRGEVFFPPIFTKYAWIFFKKWENLWNKLFFVGNKTGLLGHVLKRIKQCYPYYPNTKKALIKISKFYYLPQMAVRGSSAACNGRKTFPCYMIKELNAKWCYSYTYDTQKLYISG